MIALDVVQGSPEWAAARLAIPTCSRFGDILTPKKLQYSESAARYRNELLTEWALGYPVMKSGGSGAMERGTGMEAEARAWLELQRDYEVETTGFILRDDRRVGGSTDGVVGADGIIELKCPMAHTHIGYVIDHATLVDQYRAQVQGYLGLTGRQWADVVSYHPILPKVLVRIERDETFQAALHAALDRFLLELDAGREKLRALGVVPAPPFTRQADPEAWVDGGEDYLHDLLQASIAGAGDR